MGRRDSERRGGIAFQELEKSGSLTRNSLAQKTNSTGAGCRVCASCCRHGFASERISHRSCESWL